MNMIVALTNQLSTESNFFFLSYHGEKEFLSQDRFHRFS